MFVLFLVILIYAFPVEEAHSMTIQDLLKAQKEANVTKHKNKIIEKPRIYMIYYGENWKSSQTKFINQFVLDLKDSDWFQVPIV